MPASSLHRAGRPTRAERLERWVLGRTERQAAWSTAGAVWVVGGLLSLLLVAGGGVPADPLILALTGAALGGGAVFTRLHPARPEATELLMHAGAGFVALGVWRSGDPSSAYALMLTWVGVEGALLLSAAGATRVALSSIGAYAAALAVLPTGAADHGRFAVIAASVVLSGVLAWALRLRAEGLIASLRDAAMRDPLTEVLNRRGYQERIDALLAEAAESGRPVTVVLGDLDHFKSLNDRYGHRRGDEALRAFAAACETHARTGDIVARIGGEEFAIVLPDLDGHRGFAVAERLRTAVGKRLEALGTPGGASFGVAVYPEHGATAELLLDAADQALYVAKALGRDRTVVFSAATVAELDAQRALSGPGREQLDAMLVLADTLDLRDPSTARHSQTVARLADTAGRALGLPPARVARLRLAGLLHDIGKIGVPDAILHKPGPLTDDEYAEMQRHPSIGAHLLASAGLADLAEWVLCHHERPDGRGYPEGRGAEAIPLEARVLAVADAYEAMTADRVYRSAMSAADAADELRRCAGSQFDPEVVAAFLRATGAELAAPVAV